MADVEKITAVAEEAIGQGPNMLVPWYLIASYAYYECDDPVISDELYDRICFLLMEAIDAIEIDHMHAYLCDPESLKAGTGYQIKDYPSRVVSVAQKFMSGELPA